MRNVYVVLAATAVALGAVTAPAFAHDSQSLRSRLVDGGHDLAVAVGGGTLTEAGIVSSVPAEIPAFEKRARIGGVAEIVIDLDNAGKLSRATVQRSGGHARLDECALRAVLASTYRPETIDGRGMSARYMVEVVLDPGF